MFDVSIIIPVYNSALTICDTLESLLSQSYKNWEAICVDDGSSDDSISIIEEYCNKDSRIKLFKRTCTEKGGSVCRNIGAMAAKGFFLIFLDSDDVLAPWCIEKRLVYIKDSEYDFVVFPIGLFSDNPTIFKKTKNLNSKNHLCRFISGSPTWQTMQPIYKKTVFDRLGGFDNAFLRFQDVEFGIRAIVNCNIKIVNDVEPDCFLRLSGNSGLITPQKAKRALDSATLLLALNSKLWDSIKSDGKWLSVFGLLVNIIRLEMNVQIDPKPFIKRQGNNVDLRKMLTPKDYYIINILSSLPRNRLNRLVLKVIAKIIDTRLDYGLF